MVPRWRTGGSPMRPARWARPGIFCRTRSLAATSAWVVVAPIVMVCLRGETAQLRKVRNIDKMAGPGEALPERRDEGLSAGQQLRFGIVAEQALGLGEAAGPDIGCLIHGFCPPYSAAIGVRFARAASQTRCGLAGMSSRSTPSALAMALMTAAGDPIAPASPQPFIPNGLVLHGVTVVLTLNDTRSLARGIA